MLSEVRVCVCVRVFLCVCVCVCVCVITPEAQGWVCSREGAGSDLVKTGWLVRVLSGANKLLCSRARH